MGIMWCSLLDDKLYGGYFPCGQVIGVLYIDDRIFMINMDLGSLVDGI